MGTTITEYLKGCFGQREIDKSSKDEANCPSSRNGQGPGIEQASHRKRKKEIDVEKWRMKTERKWEWSGRIKMVLGTFSGVMFFVVWCSHSKTTKTIARPRQGPITVLQRPTAK
ncbi:hypothetical protein PoMZ_11473, partial [Pyricularia oryzae]